MALRNDQDSVKIPWIGKGVNRIEAAAEVCKKTKKDGDERTHVNDDVGDRGSTHAARYAVWRVRTPTC